MDETPATVVDELVRDGTADQRRSGVIPRTNEVRKYVIGIVEDLERRNEDSRLRIKPKAATPAPRAERSTEDMESEYAKRCQRHGIEPMEGSWTVTRDEPKPERTLFDLRDKRTRLQEQRLRARLRLLRSKPDWAARIKRVNPLALQGQLGPDKQKHAEFLIREVITESDRVFGPWMKAKPRKLHFT